MKPPGSLTATVRTEGKTLTEGSADLEVPHRDGRRGISSFEREDFFH